MLIAPSSLLFCLEVIQVQNKTFKLEELFFKIASHF